jgi:predicted site-specific integrase-resolvase
MNSQPVAPTLGTPASTLLTSLQVAQRLCVLPNTLEVWRTKGKGPKYLKLGIGKQGKVRYRESDVEAWLAECEQDSTSSNAA